MEREGIPKEGGVKEGRKGKGGRDGQGRIGKELIKSVPCETSFVKRHE